MLIVGMHKAKRHLSHLIKNADKHDNFQTSKNDRSGAKARPPTGKSMKKRPLGRLRGTMSVPEDFDTMGQEEINKLFYGE